MTDTNVIMATYNGQSYICEQIRSIDRQTVSVNKIIVVDDGSRDGTVDEIQKVAKQINTPIEVHINERNIGVIKTFEKALNLCDADFIAFCDQDDVWLPNKMEKILSEFDADKDVPQLVYSDLKCVDADLKVLNESFIRHHLNDETYKDKPFNFLALGNFIPGCAMVINKSLKEKALPFPPSIIMHDYWLALLACKGGRLKCVNEPLVLYRRHSSTVTSMRRSTNCFYDIVMFLPRLIRDLKSALSAKYDSTDLKTITYLLEEMVKRLSLKDEEVNNLISIFKNGGIKSYSRLKHLKSPYKSKLFFKLLSVHRKNLKQ